ncbi:MAG: 4Fe-4S binding protein [Ignavibacteriales bacterium]|nr:4Fe-4S binding protein [Ignavibacteriales bacterium]
MKNKIRLSFQFFFLSLILYVAIRPVFDKAYAADFEKYCPFGGLASLFSKLNQDTMACNMSETQVMLGIGLLLGAGIVGKLFCSFVCPIGTVSEWLGRLGSKLKIRREITGYWDRGLRGLKYILLFVTVYFTMTSSELFCKKFDPYFATVNLFNNSDVVLYFAIPAVLITIAGAMFSRLFWCKYLCPLGAFINIFLNVVSAGFVILLYLTINYFGAGLNYVWLLAGLVLSGWINETGFMKSFLLPFPKITRTKTACSSCGICDAKCPQGINISATETVRHIDCNLCSDCVHSCPLKQVITIKRKKSLKHLAPVAVVVLIAVSLAMASFFEFTTVSLRWGKQPAQVQVYSRTGIKTIKCYGSSMSLAGSLEGIPGVYGVDTYAKSHSVKIYYDSKIISEQEVQSALFTPAKTELYKLSVGSSEQIGVLEIGINGFFDAVDFNNLSSLLNKTGCIPGFETRFGEPVKAAIYFEKGKITQEKIVELIKQKIMIVETLRGNEEVELDFSPEGSGIIKEYISSTEYKRRIFKGFEDFFSSYQEYKPEEIAVYVFDITAALNDADKLELFAAHLSIEAGILGVSSRFEGVPQCCIHFDPSQTNAVKIQAAIGKPQLTYYITDTKTESIKNPFQNTPAGKVLKLSEILRE